MRKINLRDLPYRYWPNYFGGHTYVENSISGHVSVAAYHSQIFQASYCHIWQRCREMIQMRVSGSWHTLLTQLLLTSLLPRSIIVKDNRLECASVIRWWRWTPAGSVKLTIKECVMNRMISKWLPNVCISLCGGGFLPLYTTLNFSWWAADYFWQALAKCNALVLFYCLYLIRVAWVKVVVTVVISSVKDDLRDNCWN